MRRRVPLAVLALALLAAPARADAVDEAARALRDGRRSARDRVDAAHALAAAGASSARDRDRAVPRLVDALADPAGDVRAAAAGALARLEDPRAIPGLVARLGVETEETVLASGLLAVGETGSAGEVAAVGPFAGHASPRLRAAAGTALGVLGGEQARQRVLALLAKPGDDPDWAVRGAALLALARCGKPADAGTILVAYREGEGANRWFARAALAEAVAALDPDPVALLDRLVADEDARVSTTAAVGFVRAGRPEEVVRRLADARPAVRAAAVAAVSSTELRRALPQVREMAVRDPDRSVRWSAVLALSRLDDPAADPLLVEGVRSTDPQVWASAVAECRRKTGLEMGRDPGAWTDALASRRGEGVR